jgi:hypothetical protein
MSLANINPQLGGGAVMMHNYRNAQEAPRMNTVNNSSAVAGPSLLGPVEGDKQRGKDSEGCLTLDLTNRYTCATW